MLTKRLLCERELGDYRGAIPMTIEQVHCLGNELKSAASCPAGIRVCRIACHVGPSLNSKRDPSAVGGTGRGPSDRLPQLKQTCQVIFNLLSTFLGQADKLPPVVAAVLVARHESALGQSRLPAVSCRLRQIRRVA